MIEFLVPFLFITVLLPFVLYIRWKLAYCVLSKYDIQGPSTELFYGNYRQIRKMGILNFLEVNIKKYGHVFGYYNGIRPHVVVSDLEMLKEILVKQFDVFTDRERIPNILKRKTSSTERGLLNSRGEEWRRQRKILSKSFNAINLSKMSPLVAKSCETLIGKIGEFADTRKSLDLTKLYGLYAMEVILAGGFGHNVEVILGEADELTRAAATLLSEISRQNAGVSLLITVLSNFPFLESYVRKKFTESKAGHDFIFIEQKLKELLKARLEEGDSDSQHKDLLQLLIDARADSDEEAVKTLPPSKRKLTDVEIVRTSFSFVLAGYDTTSNALAYTSYLLALNRKEQAEICKEIDKFYLQKPDATLYDAAQNIPYLDMVLQESLRLYPPAPIINRHTSKTTVVCDQAIPEDSVVVIPIHYIHYSPEYWPEPQLFKPTRFTQEEKVKQHSLAHMPFGHGQRSCIAMRLALMEAKMAFVGILKEYQFIEAPDTEKPLKTTVGITMVPKNGVHLYIEKRTDRMS